jgi:hypothetical protein
MNSAAGVRRRCDKTATVAEIARVYGASGSAVTDDTVQ